MNKVIDKGFRSCHFVSTIVKHPVYLTLLQTTYPIFFILFAKELFLSGYNITRTVLFLEALLQN